MIHRFLIFVAKKGHITEGISTFLLLRLTLLTLVASLSKFPLQAIILHLIGTHLLHSNLGKLLLPLSEIIAYFTAITEKASRLLTFQSQVSLSFDILIMLMTS
ncbi:hypothetical protein HanPI659440_Chr08g0295731 [Helianthus annuus]|nr:hypothetical protein HanPI659440_Chr08g0295731 [Helianthus annuus]